MDSQLEEKLREVMALSKPDLQKLARKMKLKDRARATKSKLQQLIIDDMNDKIHNALRPVHRKCDGGVSMKKKGKLPCKC